MSRPGMFRVPWVPLFSSAGDRRRRPSVFALRTAFASSSASLSQQPGNAARPGKQVFEQMHLASRSVLWRLQWQLSSRRTTSVFTLQE